MQVPVQRNQGEIIRVTQEIATVGHHKLWEALLGYSCGPAVTVVLGRV